MGSKHSGKLAAMDFLTYPVSGIMKLWFVILHNLLGISVPISWVISVFGLVVTVRTLILPFAWIQYRTARTTVLLRPKLYALQEEHKKRDDPESVEELAAERKRLFKEHKHKPLAGCLPGLIQMPFIIGLYQVLIRVARPAGGIEDGQHSSVGFLTSEDVESFLHSRVHGIPLPAHVKMPQWQLDELGITLEQLRSFILPFLVCAALMSALNMLYSLYRNKLTMDYDSPLSGGLFKFFIVISIITPLFPLTFGLNGPAPAAICMYWLASSSWSALQIIGLNLMMDRKYPLGEEFFSYKSEAKQRYHERHQPKRQYKRDRRKRRLTMLVLPHRALRLHSENVEQKQRLKQARAEKKAELREEKERAKKKQAAAMTLRKKRRAMEKANAKREEEGLGPFATLEEYEASVAEEAPATTDTEEKEETTPQQ